MPESLRNVSVTTTERVGNALAQSARALSAPEIGRITGKSYNTVRFALERLGALRSEGKPAVWTLPTEMRAILRGATPTDLLVRAVDPEHIVQRWNAKRDDFCAELARVYISPQANPQTLITNLTEAASNLATLAYELERVKMNSDWYNQLIGKSDASDYYTPATSGDDSDDTDSDTAAG